MMLDDPTDSESSMLDDPSDSESSDYTYKDMPLTPGIMVELAPTLFAGRMVSRQDIINAVVKYHADHGGKPTSANSVSQIKKALTVLVKEGRVEQAPGFGLWRFPDQGVSYQPASDAIAQAERDDDISDYPIEVESELGQGSEVVYAYSYPAYRRLAELEGRDEWPVKIGRSGSVVEDRVKDQVGTGTPEWPVVHLAIYTDASIDLERLLHSALRLQGRQLDGPGAEWFNASPNWVRNFLEQSVPHILNDSTTTLIAHDSDDGSSL